MDPGIEWYEAEGNPYRPSEEAWIGPDAILKTCSCAWARTGTGLPCSLSRTTMPVTRSSWRHAQRNPQGDGHENEPAGLPSVDGTARQAGAVPAVRGHCAAPGRHGRPRAPRSMNGHRSAGPLDQSCRALVWNRYSIPTIASFRSDRGRPPWRGTPRHPNSTRLNGADGKRAHRVQCALGEIRSERPPHRRMRFKRSTKDAGVSRS
jgi:hypothetical protein